MMTKLDSTVGESTKVDKIGYPNQTTIISIEPNFSTK